ncbi:KAP family P-loop NTPase fold protein [Actomonas aquatica]|uniref:P-loop NTPase fold protein n=1 Tax=Actomonas aquatica TaxID=2866162 RepID=A0ABZ1C3P9_9BACT|nr:P-loop NTPase fold protein [Opitutus sp. WL0086]WRQ85908.1 P-loop NTPase fold protein [Opitutus sp. WL0086]
MKLRRPPLQIDPQNPFSGSLFQREQFADSLTSLIRKSQDGTVIFVNGPWGSGKSTFLKMWQSKLSNENLPCLAFDAFAADSHEDPFLSFTGEIYGLLKGLEDSRTGIEPVTRKFREAAVDVLKAAAPVAAKVALKWATAGVVGNNELGQMAEAASGTGDNLAEAAESVIRRKIEEYSASKSTTAHFKETLESAASLIRDEHDFPLTIVVDELDRCRPDFALGLLERIKHLFDVSGVVFVLFVNQRQIESYIGSVYGETVDAPSYLQKFGDLFVDIPAESNAAIHSGGLPEFFGKLLRDFNYPSDGSFSAVASQLAVFGDHFGLTLREAEHVVRVIALDGAATGNREFDWYPFREFFSVVKIKRPDLFSEICAQTTDTAALVNALRIEKLRSRANGERSDEMAKIWAGLIHVAQETHSDQVVDHYIQTLRRIFRAGETAAGYTCRRLSRFRYQP